MMFSFSLGAFTENKICLVDQIGYLTNNFEDPVEYWYEKISSVNYFSEVEKWYLSTIKNKQIIYSMIITGVYNWRQIRGP